MRDSRTELIYWVGRTKRFLKHAENLQTREWGHWALEEGWNDKQTYAISKTPSLFTIEETPNKHLWVLKLAWMDVLSAMSKECVITAFEQKACKGTTWEWCCCGGDGRKNCWGKFPEGIYVKSAMAASRHYMARHVKHMTQSWPQVKFKFYSFKALFSIKCALWLKVLGA